MPRVHLALPRRIGQKGDALTEPTWLAGHIQHLPRVGSRVTDELAADLRRHGIAAVAGSSLHGPGHVRIPLGGSADTIDRLAERLHEAFVSVDAVARR